MGDQKITTGKRRCQSDEVCERSTSLPIDRPVGLDLWRACSGSVVSILSLIKIKTPPSILGKKVTRGFVGRYNRQLRGMHTVVLYRICQWCGVSESAAPDPRGPDWYLGYISAWFGLILILRLWLDVRNVTLFHVWSFLLRLVGVIFLSFYLGQWKDVMFGVELWFGVSPVL